jgi:7-carboxy-7-deazaguanine synthase
MYDENPHITEMMITGGAPTMHPSLVNELTLFASKRGIVTTIETEGSHFLPTQVPINLLSISPKFSNSIPVIGVKTPQGDVTDEKLIKQHEKFRLNLDAIADSIIYHDDYHIKPVFDEHLSILNEFEFFIQQLAEKLHSKMYKRGFDKSASIPEIVKELKNKTWVMPAGDTREALFNSYPVIMDFCRDKGYKFTGREHIMAFNDKRCV